MKIIDVQAVRPHTIECNYAIAQVTTDEGIIGEGGLDEFGSDVVNAFKPVLIGQDPSRIAWLCERLKEDYSYGQHQGVMPAISAVESALWDIAGKAARVPTYVLLGGKYRDKIRVCQVIKETNRNSLVERSKRLAEDGYTALQAVPLPQGWGTLPWTEVIHETAKTVEAIRKAVGDDMDIALDLQGSANSPKSAAEMITALSYFQPMFVEDALGTDDVSTLSQLQDRSTVPLSTGGNISSFPDFVKLINSRATDIVRLDLSLCGGILEAKKIIAVAEASYVTIALRNQPDPFSIASILHLSAATPNLAIMEFDADGSVVPLVHSAEKPTDGYLPLPSRPGLGIYLGYTLR